jgi:murein DD-endopeptidase MepM/ murein hydrolase activator NlpD
MPMAPRSYRVGCAYACYVSDSGLPHTGQDFPVAVGTPVRSVGAGRVLRSESIYWENGEKAYCQTRPICGRDWTSYGNFVEIQDATDPTLTIWYAHLSTRGVVPGQWLAAGQPIGRSGNVGNSEGPHLHFEIRRDNKAMDPMPVLRSRGAVALPGAPPAS